MLDDDQQEKDAARNQLILFMMMAAMIFLWFNFFAPKKTQQPAENQQAAVTQSATATAVALEPAVEAAPGKPEAEKTDAVATPAGWPGLPPVATPPANPAEDEVTLTKGDMIFVFTRVGGRLKRASLNLNEHGSSTDLVQLVPQSKTPDAESVYPFGLRFSNPAVRDELDRRRFEVESSSATGVTFTLTLPGVAVVRKKFGFDPEHEHVLTATVEYQNLEAAPRVLGKDQDPAFIFTWGPNVDSQDLTKGVHQALVWRVGSETANIGTASMKPTSEGQPYTKRIPDLDWLAVRSAYFVVAMKPDFTPNAGWSLGDATQFRFGVEVPRAEVAPGGTLTSSFKVYIGPSHLTHLKKAWPTLGSALQFFDWRLFDYFAKFLLQMLNWFYSVIPNYGVAIVLLTIVVRMVMFPLTMKQMKTMKRMQMLAPEMEKIKQQYGEDPQEMQRRTMELYKEYGLNPAGGCLPMVLQLPIFVSLYRMIWSAYELRGAPFVFWIKDLSQPDRLMHIPSLSQLPWIFHNLEYINVLPLLSALAMVASVKLTPMSGPVQNPQQKMMMTLMPVMFSLFCYSLASGVNVYILTSTVLGIAQSYVMRMFDVDKPEKVKAKKKQHFYTAAIEKKKQAERDLKEKKKRKDNKQSGDIRS